MTSRRRLTSGIQPPRTISRNSNDAGWVEDSRRREKAHRTVKATVLAASVASKAADGGVEAKLAADAVMGDAKSRVLQVLGQDQKFLDELASDLREAYAGMKDDARNPAHARRHSISRIRPLP